MSQKLKCFVIMPFAKEFDAVYQHGIKPGVDDVGYDCIRADEIAGAGNVIRHIVETTYEADAVIADLTAANANVMYELGVAHGLRKHVILLTQEVEKTPFDLKNYRIIGYDRNDFNAANDVRSKIGKALKALNDKKQARTNPVHDFLPPAVSQSEYESMQQENARLKEQNLKLQGTAQLANEILREIGSHLDLKQIQKDLENQVGDAPLTVPTRASKLIFKKVPESNRVKVNLPPPKPTG